MKQINKTVAGALIGALAFCANARAQQPAVLSFPNMPAQYDVGISYIPVPSTPNAVIYAVVKSGAYKGATAIGHLDFAVPPPLGDGHPGPLEKLGAALSALAGQKSAHPPVIKIDAVRMPGNAVLLQPTGAWAYITRAEYGVSPFPGAAPPIVGYDLQLVGLPVLKNE